jgi:hypothetical protein
MKNTIYLKQMLARNHRCTNTKFLNEGERKENRAEYSKQWCKAQLGICPGTREFLTIEVPDYSLGDRPIRP